ncbi:S9 family peptidase [Planctomicrobium sp. SH668]|uniref:S9 family peptidase n=1 Tax=Planctomicrobium sp. SH668 TaxID=3448126 RepID=UPI003F5BE3F4
MKYFLSIAITALLTTITLGDDSSSSRLTVARLFRDHEFSSDPVRPMHWSRSQDSYFRMHQRGIESQLIRHDLSTGQEEVIIKAAELIPSTESAPLNVESFQLSEDETQILIFTNSQRVWRHNTRGDFWVFDRSSRKLSKLGGDSPASSLLFAKFSPDGKWVAYVRENNLYAESLENHQIRQLTTDGSATVINGTSDWVNEEELSIRDAFRWSPDSRQIAYWQFDTENVRHFEMIDNSTGNYPKIIRFPYPKVGEQNSAVRAGVVSLETAVTNWFQLPGDPREHYIAQVEWIPGTRKVVVQQMNRLQNTNQVILCEPDDGTVRTILVEKDDAWLENDNPFRWLQNGRAFLWMSERNGWRHLYRAEFRDQVDFKVELTPVTSGEFDVIQPEAIDDDNGWIYFSASPTNATQRYLYRVSVNGGKTRRLSDENQSGWHTYQFSNNAKWAVHSYSTFTTPPVIRLLRFPDHEVVRVITENEKLKAKLAELGLPKAEFFKIHTADAEMDGWCIQPNDFDPNQKYPLLIHVYGEPHGQTVRDSWMGARNLWHFMLAQQGYIVVSMENRGTNIPKGRAWRKCVYRQIGILASQDQAEATREFLLRRPEIDAKRVGIWGWSGGGSMSLNAIFRYPDIYQTAIAVAPMADQRLYDTIYQERYMGLLDDNRDGYEQGSPVTFAKNLKGNLLLVHGTGDDNCHYQVTEQLINELILHDRIFSQMPYPGRSHSLSEGTNTVPHFYEILTRYLHANLPTNADVPKETTAAEPK